MGMRVYFQIGQDGDEFILMDAMPPIPHSRYEHEGRAYDVEQVVLSQVGTGSGFSAAHVRLSQPLSGFTVTYLIEGTDEQVVVERDNWPNDGTVIQIGGKDYIAVGSRPDPSKWDDDSGSGSISTGAITTLRHASFGGSRT